MLTLSNDNIRTQISEQGAELCSLVQNGFEYIWQADKKYWGRHAPILFPIVGMAYRTPLPQHGFARDREFQLLNLSETEAIFMLRSDEETLDVYPYRFELEVNYQLKGTQLITRYTVRNIDDKEIYFQIGGHPAFNYPNRPFQRGYLQLTKEGIPLDEISVRHINSDGFVIDSVNHIELANGCLRIKDDTFDSGAMILENEQCDTISLIKGNGEIHLSLSSQAMVFGVWSPAHKNAPFVCLEPWMGRADKVGYQGAFEDRDYINRVSNGEEMKFEYIIDI